MASEHKIVFYAEDSRITGRNTIWVQNTLIVIVHIFERLDLQKNLRKTNMMVRTPGFILGQKCEAVYKKRALGEGEFQGKEEEICKLGGLCRKNGGIINT